MRKRAKGLVAMIISLLLVYQLIPNSVMEAVAAEIDVIYTTENIDFDASGDTYTIYGSGGVVNVLSGGSVGTVNVNAPDAGVSTELNINAGGTVGNVVIEAGGVANIAGTVSSISSAGELTFDGGSVGTLTVNNGSFVVNGALTVGVADINIKASGTGSIEVTSALNYSVNEYNTIPFIVEKDTVITTSSDISVTYNGGSFDVPGGTNGLTFSDLYGYSLSAADITFDNIKVGYNQITGKTVTVTNTKTERISLKQNSTHTNFKVEISGGADIESTDNYYLDAGESVDIIVTPVAGLLAGNYHENIQLTILNESISIPISITVDEKLQGTGEANMPDYYYGGKPPAPTIYSSTNGVGNTKVYYKVYKSGDETYISTVPTEVGDYTMKVTFAETGVYQGVTVTDDFSVAYLPIPSNPYTVQGTKGNNNFYVTQVKLVPAEGYLVATELNGDYKEAIYYNGSVFSEEIYFKKISTGEMTDALVISDMLIDMSVPNMGDLVDGNTYYEDNKEAWITDSNLKTVTVNGENALLMGTQARLILDSLGGETEYNIVATDYAGNKSQVTIIMAAEWTKTGIIPNGQQVRLNANKLYSFGDGSWQVSGDSTTYSGGSNFYVGEEGDYTFTQQ